MVFYVDKQGVVDFRGPPTVRLGPILSEVNGKIHFTLGMSAQEVRDLDYNYQQLQVGM